MRSKTTLALTAALALLAASPAAADDGRRHVMTPAQKIDLVRDLPDIGAFERDGQYFDLGYIYPIHTVNGASVASASGGESGYVLYHDDYYVHADGSIMAGLESVLGEDPTQGYTPPRPTGAPRLAADPWGANAAADKARGEPIAPARAPGSSGRRGGSVIATLFLVFVLLFLRMRVFRDLVIGGVLAGIASLVRDRAGPDHGAGSNVPSDTFGSQAATQRARLDALSSAPASAPIATSGAFGRKGLAD